MTYSANAPCEFCGKWRCECPPPTWTALGEIYEKAFNGRFKPNAPELPPDCNTRFSVTSPSPALVNLLNGEMTVRNFVGLTQTTSLFHTYITREGRGVFYNAHTDSLAAGLGVHAQQVHESHLQKSSNANLQHTTAVGSATTIATSASSPWTTKP